MSVRMQPLVPGLVQKLIALAEFPWERASRKVIADRFGWRWSPEFDGFETGTGHILRPFDPDSTTGPGGGFFLDFCLLSDLEDDDPQLDDLAEEWDDLPWRLTPDAGRKAFDANWQSAVNIFTQVLSSPIHSGVDADPEYPWRHAAWRIGDVVLAVAQGDDLVSQSDSEVVSVWLREYPAGEPLPDHSESFLDWLCEDLD